MKEENYQELCYYAIGLLFIAHILGFEVVTEIVYIILTALNTLTTELLGFSILTAAFKYCVTFPLVGFILTAIGSPRGKCGSIIGKVLYFVVGYCVALIFDHISLFIF